MAELNPNETVPFVVAMKTIPTSGNLVYEYNPFYNYRLDQTMYKFRGKLMTESEFLQESGLTLEQITADKATWAQLLPNDEAPTIYQKGQLTDFETDELSFSLKHPVNILPQWSYDNSVNLIINDGLNPPRLINSRFSITERNKYQVVDRKGNNDSNIYDRGEQFDIDTSLYKKIISIPTLQFLGVQYGGNLSIGNYHFYFRYVDDDGNESDYFAESGLISIFIGNTPDSIYTGFRNQNASKSVKFLLSNTDVSYSDLVIYYTKATADIYENATVQAYKIEQTFKLSDSGNTVISISGFEPTVEVSIDEINTRYQIYGAAETQTAAQNMLFLGNLERPNIPYNDLADCALRFLPTLNTSEKYNTEAIGPDYTGSVSGTYYDPMYIYNKVGYWDDEFYRLGIVFILSDNTLTDVFNIRGAELDSNILETDYNQDSFITDGVRNYINYDEQYYRIGNSEIYENARGVIKINCPDYNTVIGIDISVPQEVINYLRDTLKVRGWFFVRQKRIPTTLCQAYTIAIDKESHTPILPIQETTQEGDEQVTTKKYITESFFNTERVITHDFQTRLRNLEENQVLMQGAICPEYDINSAYLNTMFSGTQMSCRKSTQSYLNQINNNFYYKPDSYNKEDVYTSVKVIGVEDNVKLVAINDNMFSARAGEAEEGFRYEYIGKENKDTNATNIIRGSYGPFLGITGLETCGELIDIKIPGYSSALINDYMSIRFNDKSGYYAISDRYDITNEYQLNSSTNYSKEDTVFTYKKLSKPLYRGDCYICQFTHRVNRNFQDPSAPANDDIVDPNTWKDNYEVSDGVVDTSKFEEINLGDLNAVQMGMYVTLTVRSTYNLNIRAIDDSNSDELAMFGHPRGFYPYNPLVTSGSYKIPEALCYNKGFEKSLSERVNMEVPDVPWIKNEFSNRIAYSNIQIQDAFQNGWRTFMGTHYRDYPKTYGSITKLVELRGNLVCVFEHGVALIPVNERAIAGEGAGGNVFINTSNVLPENPKVLSDVFGSQWRDSVIKTPMGIYGVDTVAKKIWRTNGDVFECISDFKVQEFLNQNISLTERELEPIIGVRNVKTHFNRYKNDVMFTFYDNLYGLNEKVWNLCFNELQQKWITFYSWVPSYSENIYNQFFSFDRNTSKQIAKLGVSKSGNDFSDGVTLENNIITSENYQSKLNLSNRNLPKGVNYTITYELLPDAYSKYVANVEENGTVVPKQLLGNYNLFTIEGSVLKVNPKLKGDFINLVEAYIYEKELTSDLHTLSQSAPSTSQYSNVFKTDEYGRLIKAITPKNEDRLIIYLNIRATINFQLEGSADVNETYVQKYRNYVSVDGTYYDSIVALTYNKNLQLLFTDFWKHGQAGIIDIADKINPAFWYGKQHPFEFEFIVNDNPQFHKIFDNLQIISNSAEPESFHYEVIGDSYNFAEDKKNMYIRQEATKELYAYNGCDITYDTTYPTLTELHRPLYNEDGKETGFYERSAILPLYYSRQDSVNEIEDYYHLLSTTNTKDFSALSGGEVKYNPTTREFSIWSHAKAVDMQKRGRLRGNMQYNEDRWLVQINPINVIYKNEKAWDTEDLLGDRIVRYNKIPIEINQAPIPNEVLEKGEIVNIPPNSEDRAIVAWNNVKNDEVKIKDKYIKIRIRYTGDKLAIINAIKTLYSISYG